MLQSNNFSSLSGIIEWFSQSWIYAGALLAMGIFLTLYFGFFQFRRITQMRKCYFKTENMEHKSISAWKIFILSLASRFGLGNVVGVGFAVVIGGPGIVIWMIIAGFLSMSVALVENTLSQYYHEKDPNNKNTFRGGVPYYILKGLGKSWKWLAISYAICAIMCKGVFIMGSVSNVFTNIVYYTFTNSYKFLDPVKNNIPSATSNNLDWIIWLIVAVLFLIYLLIAFGGTKRVIGWSNIITPIALLSFFIFVIFYVFFNIKYLPDSIKYIFEGFVAPNKIGIFSNALTGVVAWKLAVCIKQGAIRGIFAHEAGQGTTPTFSAIPKINNPIKMGFGQALAVFVDISIICMASGILFTMSLLKCNDLFIHNHPNAGSKNLIIDYLTNGHGSSSSNIQGWFCVWSVINFLPSSWTHFLYMHNLGWINVIFAFIFLTILFFSIIGLGIGSITICEFSAIFLFKNTPIKKQRILLFFIRLIVPISVILSPLIMMLSKSVFSLADLFVAISFLINGFAILMLLKLVKIIYSDFEEQAKQDLQNKLNKYIYLNNFKNNYFGFLNRDKKIRDYYRSRRNIIKKMEYNYEFKNKS